MVDVVKLFLLYLVLYWNFCIKNILSTHQVLSNRASGSWSYTFYTSSAVKQSIRVVIIYFLHIKYCQTEHQGRDHILSTHQVLSNRASGSWLSTHQVLSKRASGSWSYGSSIYNYLCNQCISSLKLWVWILLRCTRYHIMW